MKAFGMLLLYFFSWRSVIVGSALLGLALLALAMSIATITPRTAAAVALFAFIFMLVVPYLSVPKAFRTLISNRRLAIVPGFPLRAGLAMLLLTLVTAAFLPVGAWLLGAPPELYWIGLHVFIIASLYTLVTQLLVTSRHMWLHINWLPVAGIVLLSPFREELWLLVTSPAAMAILAAVALTCWIYLLLALARRPDFKPAYATNVRDADSELNSRFAALVNRKPGHKPAPTTSLLLGYPANLRSRAANAVFLLVANPLLCVALVHFLNRDVEGPVALDGTNLFLIVSLVSSFISGAMGWSETGARARLLWLRLPGALAEVWRHLERELWDYFLLLLGVVVLVAVATILLGEASMLLVHYALTLFALTFYQRYLPLAARLNGWPSLVLTLVQMASLAAIGVTLTYSLRIANLNLGFLLELCLLLLGVLFRALAKHGFQRVDWQVLRYSLSKRVEAASA